MGYSEGTVGGYSEDTVGAVRVQWGTVGYSEDTVNIQSGNNGPPCGGRGGGGLGR